MARGYIKQEPVDGSGAPSSVDFLAGGSPAGRAAAKAGNPRRGHHSTIISDTEPSERRGIRSAAPSLATRPQLPGTPATEDEDGGEPECILMEVRPRIKVLPEEENTAHQNNMSFMSNPAFQAIGQKLKEVNDTLGTLQSLGIQHVASLPELVLVGDQSAGKSSIMSAIAGLNLPHNTGVCTRCPVHIRSSRAIGPDWTCHITLQQDYAFKPSEKPLTQDDVTKDNPFPPWVRQARVVKEFMTIREKVDSIEQVLRWAQVAILNHDRNHEQFIPKEFSDNESQEDDSESLAREEARTLAKFSPNTVALEIRGPDLPDLSFYDLPGVFANARHYQDQYLADVVLNLTREYISHRGAIILWAVPMNTDPENSTTFRVIREENAVQRCLGVMTKADLLPRGGYEQWIDILEGRFHQTGLGYFITSRPDKGDLDAQTGWEEAFFNRRAGESSFETKTWPNEFDGYEEKCGVVRLKDFLSRKLAEDFARSLPAVKSIIQKRLHDAINQLRKLPELPPNPELEIRKALLEFTNLAQTCLKGPEFLDVWKTKNKDFSATILAMKPKYIVKPPATNNVIDLDSDTPMNSNTPSQQPKRRSATDHYVDVQATPSKRRGNGVSVTSGASGIKIEDLSPNVLGGRSMHLSVAPITTPMGLRSDSAPMRSRSLEDVRAIIESKRQPGMPHSTPDAVYEFLCKESVQPWGKPMTTFMNETMKLVHAEMNKALDNAFSLLKRRTVYREAKRLLTSFLKDHRRTLSEYLTCTHALERQQLYTTNTKFFAINQESELRELTRHRHYYRWAALMGQQSAQNDRPRPGPYDEMTDEEKQQEQARMAKELPKMGRDPFEQEVQVAAYVRGYYLTAALRFIDNVSLRIISGTFPTVAESINMHLDKELGLMDQADQALFDRLMEEEPKTAEQRTQLKEEKRRFEKAMESILALEKSASTSGEDIEADEEMDLDGDISMAPGSPMLYPLSLRTGEVL